MDYRIIARLPSGGFSELFEVEDAASALPERLILKRLNASMSALPAVRAAFSEEAALLRELRHPNIVTFRRCHYDPQQRVCLLMEKVQGAPLDAWVRRHAAAPGAVLDLFDQVLGAVDYLHHRSVPFLHLDLKPDNVLVADAPEGPQPVLIDFGIARRAGGAGLKAYTPPYGAPEQEAGGRLDGATDVYALGQILEEILAVLPRPEPALQAVAARAKSALPRERFADAGAMRLAYRRARRTGVAGDAGNAGERAAPSRRGRPGLGLSRVAAIAAAVLAVSGVIGWAVHEAASPAAGGKPEAGIAPPAAPAADAAEVRRRFQVLQANFEERVIERRCSLADPFYLEARDLSDTLPEGAEEARLMKQDLEEMRRSCQLIEAGGPAGEAVIVALRQKHLSYPQP